MMPSTVASRLRVAVSLNCSTRFRGPGGLISVIAQNTTKRLKRSFQRWPRFIAMSQSGFVARRSFQNIGNRAFLDFQLGIRRANGYRSLPHGDDRRDDSTGSEDLVPPFQGLHQFGMLLGPLLLGSDQHEIHD